MVVDDSQSRSKKRPLPANLSLERFAAGKDGKTNAYAKKKQAIKRQIHQKATLKRQYKRVLAQEGYGDTSTQKTESDVSATTRKPSTDGSSRPAKQPKPDPFRKAKAAAEQRTQDADARKREKERVEKEKSKKMKERRKKHSLLTQRTSKGQPIMKNQIQCLLQELQKGAA